MDNRTRVANENQIKTASGLNIIAGLWLAISPWVYGYRADMVGTPGGVWNSVIVGLLIALFAAIRAFGSRTDAWLSWVNVVLGAWVFISPWVYGYADNTGRLWNSLIVGIVVFGLALWSAMAQTPRRTRPMTPA